MSSSLTMVSIYIISIYRFFFFQAEDGIRDYKVTGVQTCALPIWQLLQAQASGVALFVAALCVSGDCLQFCVFGSVLGCQLFALEFALDQCNFSQIGRASCRERV